eukprot:514995_1
MTKHSIQKEKEENNSMLFYPSYCYAKVKKLNFNKMENEFEYYMSVGLNSNINQDDFKRKHLNLVILLDKSGSMNDTFVEDNTQKMKMNVANESVVALLKHLTEKDKFGLITFDSTAVVRQDMVNINEIDMDKLKENILNFYAGGGTNFQNGYETAIGLYESMFEYGEYKMEDEEYDNRIIIITDAQPTDGYSNGENLLKMVDKYANNGLLKTKKRIYTTFIGVGLDFN